MPQNENAQEPTAPKEASQQKTRLQRNFDELESLYANNVMYESSVWDLKLLFGQLEQTSGSETVDFHTAMTVPWQVAKLMIYFLRLNVAIHEMENGQIRINPRVLPPEPAPLLPPEFENNERAKRVHEMALKLHAEFLAEQK